MFDHGPVEKEEFRTPSEALKKQRSSLLMRLAIHAVAGGIAPPGESRPKVVLKPIRIDEERFGKASPALTQPLLAGNRGKLSRKKRKAMKKQDLRATVEYNEILAQHFN